MKKIMTILLGILLVASVSADTSTGEIAATIAQTTTVTATYPTALAATPAVVTPGVALAPTVAVQATINDNSMAGFSLQIDGNGVLTNTVVAGATMAYDLVITNIGGTLGTGLTFTPTGAVTLGTPITCSGAASTATVDYTFDITMEITAAETTDKPAGDYSDNVTLTVLTQD